MKDMLIKIKDKIKEVLPEDKGTFDRRFTSGIGIDFDRNGMLRIQFRYECSPNENLDNDIQKKILSAIYDVTKTNPEQSSKSISTIMRKKPDTFEFDSAGIDIFNLTYNVSLSQRVTRHSMRTLLGLD